MSYSTHPQTHSSQPHSHAPPLHQPPSCWTCRVRRKKCDRTKPRCHACSALEITCHYSEARPEWMDGGDLQNEMAKRIKAEVRQGAEARRERQYVQVLTLHEDRMRRPDDLSEERPAPHKPQMQTMHQRPSFSSIAVDVETDFTITFLDYVFPFLFPFYQPSVLEGGRSWLLAMLRSNTAFFHSGMSLSAYFFTLILKGGERHQVCSQQIWNKLVAHVDTAVRAMQQDMEDLKRGQDGRTTIFQKGKTMESIIQLLILEHSMARTSDWNVHLSAAMAIFQEVFEEYGVGMDGKPDIPAVIQALSRPSWNQGMMERVVWHCDQGAFRFFSAFLLYTDIVASTSLESPPRLRNYHNLIIQDDTPNQPCEMLRMESFFGCQGWVLLIVSDIAVLDAWKKENKARGTFCLTQLTEHGSRLHQRLQSGLARLERESFKKRPFDITAVLRSYYRPDAAHQMRIDEQVAATRIWALASMAYLSVVVTGWASAMRTATSSIAVAMQLLYGISSPAVLKSLTWPFYVLGCLATREQEQLFTHMSSSMGALLEFGTIGESMRIMKRVWELRDSGGLDLENWDIAACSRVYGKQVLMI
ncbi:fungal-specific transcription factor domain-containing protein [Diaporthe sp. PMI_573]|nr:fungal-specific transcription factor domain-containing protein [Diaporthaceae sp. PMI_573]